MSDVMPNIETALLAIQYELKAPKSQYNSDDTKDADTTNTGSTPPTKAYKCADCGNDIQPVKKKDGTQWRADEMARFSQKKYGRCLCGDCMKVAEKKRANDIALAGAAIEAMHDDAGDRI